MKLFTHIAQMKEHRSMYTYTKLAATQIINTMWWQ